MRTLLIPVAISLVALLGCGDGHGDRTSRPTPTVTPAIVAGIYDATITRASGSPTHTSSTGSVNVLSDGEVGVFVRLGVDRSLDFGGHVGADGTMSGDGGLLVTDIGAAGHGDAVFSDKDGVHTVTGSFRTEGQDGPESEDAAFVLLRPVSADATEFNGSYRFTFANSPSFCGCPSTIDVDLTFDASGSGTATASVERDERGASLASLGDGGATISPNAQLEAFFGYNPVTNLGLSRLLLIGEIRLSDTGVSGEGEAFVGGITADLGVGPWSVSRLP